MSDKNGDHLAASSSDYNIESHNHDLPPAKGNELPPSEE